MKWDSPVRCYVAPQPNRYQQDPIKLLIFPDGNERSKEHGDGGGLGGGRRKLVEVLTHLRRRGIVHLVLCVLSPDNVTKRGDPFYVELCGSLSTLCELVATGVLADVRVRIVGSTRRLYERGGPAAECAERFDALERATRDEEGFTLDLAVDCGAELARDVDLVLRTGMEHAGSVRLSGTDVDELQIVYGTTALWPELEMREIDAACEIARRNRTPSFARGHDLVRVSSIVRGLTGQRDLPRVEITLQTDASECEVHGMLERLYASGSDVAVSITTVYYSSRERGGRRYNAGRARHVLRIFDASRPVPERAGGFDVIVAPGQSAQQLRLPARPRLGRATVWESGTSAQEVVAAITRAVRAYRENPPLHGADRHLSPPPAASVRHWIDRLEVLSWHAEQHPRASMEQLAETMPNELRAEISSGDVLEAMFVAKLAAWARHHGVCRDLRAVAGGVAYARTAFRLVRHPAIAEDVGRYMLLVAVGDILLDARLSAETAYAHRHRIMESTAFLRATLRAGHVPQELPSVAGRSTIAAIAAQWVDLMRRLRSRAHAEVFRRWRATLDALYAGSVSEFAYAPGDHRLVDDLARVSNAPEDAVRALLGPSASEVQASVTARIATLVEACRHGAADAVAELRIIVSLHRINTIGAGLAYWTAALHAPPNDVTEQRVCALQEALSWLDWRIRVANDASGLAASGGRDRDAGKHNVIGVLIPNDAVGAERIEAVMRALRAGHQLSRWLNEQLDLAIARLCGVWPEMAAAVARGKHIGVAMYAGDLHYATASAAQTGVVLAGAS